MRDGWMLLTGAGAALVAWSCAGKVAPTQSANPSVRFAIEVSGAPAYSIFVLVDREDGQPGWISVLVDGQPVLLRESCAIPDCGSPPSVCGLTPPVVVDLAQKGGAGKIEFQWNRTTSVRESPNACERRVPAPAGEYLARFCYSSRAVLPNSQDPSVPERPRLIEPVCREQSFSMSDSAVVLRL
jgi:hypothetical protein